MGPRSKTEASSGPGRRIRWRVSVARSNRGGQAEDQVKSGRTRTRPMPGKRERGTSLSRTMLGGRLARCVHHSRLLRRCRVLMRGCSVGRRSPAKAGAQLRRGRLASTAPRHYDLANWPSAFAGNGKFANISSSGKRPRHGEQQQPDRHRDRYPERQTVHAAPRSCDVAAPRRPPGNRRGRSPAHGNRTAHHTSRALPSAVLGVTR